jgi:hypothetical protein
MSNILADSLYNNTSKDNNVYVIGEQGDLGGIFNKLDDNEQQVVNESMNRNKDNKNNQKK